MSDAPVIVDKAASAATGLSIGHRAGRRALLNCNDGSVIAASLPKAALSLFIDFLLEKCALVPHSCCVFDSTMIIQQVQKMSFFE